MKAKYSVKMFSNIGFSSLVLKRYDGDFVYYDLTSEGKFNKHTLFKMVLSFVL